MNNNEDKEGEKEYLGKLYDGTKNSYDFKLLEEREILKSRSSVCYYVMSLAKYGEVFRLRDANEKFSDELVRYMFRQLMDGLAYLHSKGVVHRDIKPENLLIDKGFRLIIADFNFAIRLRIN